MSGRVRAGSRTPLRRLAAVQPLRAWRLPIRRLRAKRVRKRPRTTETRTHPTPAPADRYLLSPAAPPLAGAAFLASVPPSGNKQLVGRFMKRDFMLSMRITW